jgi:hypothetical protein
MGNKVTRVISLLAAGIIVASTSLFLGLLVSKSLEETPEDQRRQELRRHERELLRIRLEVEPGLGTAEEQIQRYQDGVKALDRESQRHDDAMRRIPQSR